MWLVVSWDWQIGIDGEIMYTFASAAYMNFLQGRIVFKIPHGEPHTRLMLFRPQPVSSLASDGVGYASLAWGDRAANKLGL
jgi:hypothetical protein